MRKRVERRGRHKVYRRARRTSSEAFVSGGICGLPQEEQRGLRREIYLGLVSFAPSGLVPFFPRADPRLAPWAAFFRRFAADVGLTPTWRIDRRRILAYDFGWLEGVPPRDSVV